MQFASSLVSGPACASLAGLTPALSAASRQLSVLAWGRNVEGQCGVETSVVALRPTPIIELQGVALQQLVAGKVASGAVCEDGESLTWGCGKSGKLGHGNADACFSPTRVEGLFGRADVQGISMGDVHTLFRDTQGGLWAVGENKEGQCGLGTPLEVIASQHRQAFHDSFRSVRDAASLTTHMHASDAREQRIRQHIQGLMNTSNSSQQYASSYAGGPGASGRGSAYHQSHAASTVRMPHISSTPDGARMSLGFGGFDPQAHFSASGLQPGQQHTPMRIGRDAHPLMSWYRAKGSSARASSGPRESLSAMSLGHQPSVNDLHSTSSSTANSSSSAEYGLANEDVIATSASRYFSAALTAKGEVWTFGACYSGALGSHSSWSTSAQRVSGPLSSMLEDLGGATAVAAGGTFCMALTAAGKAVVWGKLQGGEGKVLSLTSDGVGVTAGERTVAGVVPGLPRLTHIAAGQQHALVSDGESIWSMGRWMNREGREGGSAHWSQPELLLMLPAGQRVKSLVCGAHSSSVVTQCGQMYMWGRLLDRHQVDGLVRRYLSHSVDSLPEDADLSWAGFGADKPSLVHGLSGPVTGVALGGWHALVSIA